MGDSLAEVVQLQRSEEQANGKRVRWEFRTQERRVTRGAPPMRVLPVRVPRSLVDILGQHGIPSAVARGILMAWARKVSKATRAPL